MLLDVWFLFLSSWWQTQPLLAGAFPRVPFQLCHLPRVPFSHFIYHVFPFSSQLQHSDCFFLSLTVYGLPSAAMEHTSSSFTMCFHPMDQTWSPMYHVFPSWFSNSKLRLSGWWQDPTFECLASCLFSPFSWLIILSGWWKTQPLTAWRLFLMIFHTAVMEHIVFIHDVFPPDGPNMVSHVAMFAHHGLATQSSNFQAGDRTQPLNVWLHVSF